MKNTFPGYYSPTEAELSEMWESCHFVLDANVLLNLYRYSPETRGEFLNILEEISDRLWVPHQAALEYHRNRLGVIEQQASAYDSVQKLLDDSRKRFENDLRSLTGKGRHPFVDADHLLERITIVFAEIKEEMRGLSQEHPDLIDEDLIRDSITDLLDGRIGSPYPSERIGEICKAGKARYESKTPPGYRDAAKGGTRQYGDLIVWLQIIDQAKATKGPIILVTDDRKDDWWLNFKGQTIGPRPELVNEIVSEAGVSFHMYSADPFMEHAREYLKRQISQQAIEEVREVRQRDEEHSRVAHLARAMQLTYGVREAMRAAAQLPHETLEAMRAVERLTYGAGEAMRAAAQLPHETLEAMRAVERFTYGVGEAMRAVEEEAEATNEVEESDEEAND